MLDKTLKTSVCNLCLGSKILADSKICNKKSINQSNKLKFEIWLLIIKYSKVKLSSFSDY